MRKTLLAITLAATGFVVLPGVSLAADSSYNGGYFINGGVGRTDVNNDTFNNNDTGYTLNGGYRWGIFGVELGYTDLGSFNQNVVAGTTPLTLKGKVHGPTLGADMHLPVGDNFYVSGRAGVYHFDGYENFTGADTSGNPLVVTDSESGYKPYGGVGVGYDFANNLSVGVNYDYYEAKKNDFDMNTRMLSVNAEYRF